MIFLNLKKSNNMSTNPAKKFCILIIGVTLISCSTFQKPMEHITKDYVPDDLELYNEIVNMDTEFFAAYNHCDMRKQEEIYSDSIEFFKEQVGLMTYNKGIVDAKRKNIGGKITRR